VPSKKLFLNFEIFNIFNFALRYKYNNKNSDNVRVLCTHCHYLEVVRDETREREGETREEEREGKEKKEGEEGEGEKRGKGEEGEEAGPCRRSSSC
jgi:hypothetical protein